MVGMENATMPYDQQQMDGDWCLIDLSDEVTGRATDWAHALGMDFHGFMHLALEEKMARLVEEAEFRRRTDRVKWAPPMAPKYWATQDGTTD